MLKTSTPRLSQLVASIFLSLFLIAGARAQAPGQAVQQIDPAATDPGYAARKAGSSFSVLAMPKAVSQLGTLLAGPLPDCFELADTVSTPANGGFTAMPRGDDNSVGPIALGFNFSLFGTVYNSCYINNNGNLTFNNPLSSYSSQGFPNSTPMVTAFWGDVDTRSTGSGRVWYKVYPDRLVVLWNRVNYYTNGGWNTPMKNTFQLIIRRNTVLPLPSPDVTFAYGDMQWTTGTASSGIAGLGGIPATVGVNQGNGTGNYIQTGRFNDGSIMPPLASYPVLTTLFSGVAWLAGRCVSYSVAPSGNLPPTATGFPSSNTITVNQGQTVTFSPQFAAPEAGQTTTVMVDTDGLCNTTATVGSGGSPIVTLSVTGAFCNIGAHTIHFIATDNGTPVASSTFDLVVIVNPSAQWTGAVSTAYEEPGNWNLGAVPGLTDDVLIPASAPRMPVLRTTQSVANLLVASGASLTLNATGELTLDGSLMANGTCQGTGTVHITGNGSRFTGQLAPQTIGGSSGLAVGNLTVGPAGAELAGPLQVKRMLVLDGNLATNGQPCTLLSDATGTALVVNNGNAQVIGNVLVQRYLDPSSNAGRGYRHFAAPVQSTTFDDLNVSGQFAPVANAAYNTAATPGSVVPYPTVFGYDETRLSAATSFDFDRGWTSPTATSATMTPGLGYTVNMAAGLTVDFYGTLNNGSILQTGLTRGSGSNSGWQLLGNPYPAPLDWDLVYSHTSGLEDAVYVFNSTGQYSGSYAAYVNHIGSRSARYLGVGQAFFVRASTASTAGMLPFSNAMRLTSYQNVAMQRQANATAANDQRLQLRLDLVASNQQTEETYVYFENGATTGFDRTYDAHKVSGGSQLYLASGITGSAFSINGLPALTAAGATVPLLTYVPQAGTYTLRVGSLLNFDAGTSLWLEDRQSGLWHDLRQQPDFAFQANFPADAATRFVLHIGQARALAATTQLPAEAVQVYPNPASGQLNVQLAALPKTAATAQLVLSNILGQAVRQQSVALRSGTATATFDLSGLAPGVYTLRGTTETHAFSRSVVVK